MAKAKLGSSNYKGPVHEAVRNSPLGFLFGKQGSSTKAASPTTTTRTPLPPKSSYSGIQQEFMGLPREKQGNTYKLMSKGMAFRPAVEAQRERSIAGTSMFSIPTMSTAKAMVAKARPASPTSKRKVTTTRKATPKAKATTSRKTYKGPVHKAIRMSAADVSPKVKRRR